MAGERCTKAFWDEVKDPSGATGTICRSGGKRKASRYGRGTEKMEINRDRTVVEGDGDIKRYLWGCAIAEFDRDENTLTFRDCGYETKTTKHRLNQVLPGDRRIRQEDFVWYMDDNTWPGTMDLSLNELTAEEI